MLKKAEDMGFAVSAAAEYEFFLFEETPDSVREKGYRDLKNITPGFFGYSVLRSGVHAEFYHELLDLADAWISRSRACTPRPAPACSRPRSASTMRCAPPTRRRCSRPSPRSSPSAAAGWRPSWPSGRATGRASPATSMSSLRDMRTGKGAFYDAPRPHNMSDEMRWFVGGQQKLMPELLAMVACTVNSYTRLIPGFWAPTDAAWGVENRTTALRVIPGSQKSQRVEYRVAAADINPYIALAAAIGSGLWGIENGIEPASRSRATPMR